MLMMRLGFIGPICTDEYTLSSDALASTFAAKYFFYSLANSDENTLPGIQQL